MDQVKLGNYWVMTSFLVPFVLFSLNLHGAAQFVVYGHLMTLDDSLSLNPNQCHHPLITQLSSNKYWKMFVKLRRLNFLNVTS